MIEVRFTEDEFTTEDTARLTAATKSGLSVLQVDCQKSWVYSTYASACQNNPKLTFPRSAFVPIAHVSEGATSNKNGSIREVRNRDECATSSRRLTVFIRHSKLVWRA